MAELADIPIEQVAQAQQRALMRLQVKVTGETHRLLGEYLNKLRDKLLAYADEEGKLAPESYFALVEYARATWAETFGAWQRLFEAARREAVAIPFGSLARYHQYFMNLVVKSLVERRDFHPSPPPERTKADYSLSLRGGGLGRGFEEQGPARIGVQGVPFFEPQLQEILDATAQRVYSDGFRLSGRIWRLDQESLAGIQSVIQETLATGNSAWNAAKKLETYLGAGADCPRWTSTRLYRLTKADIAAGDERGLIRGTPCESKGVAYNALRLARNEIQIAHHAATDMIMARQPWVEKEQIVLSPAHPEPDICDDVAGGGEKGEGIYPKGTILLPLHVQCLCFKVAALMPPDEFTRRMRDWMQGKEAWPEMDRYAAWLGLEPQPLPLDAEGFPLAVDGLEEVRRLGGSTGATLVRDRRSGQLYVMKRGASPEHLREEAMADALYQALGVKVPRFRIYETEGGPVKLAEFIEGRTLRDVLDNGTRKQIEAALKKLQKDFAADALLGNWDVIGLNYDNILIDARGGVWRIDNGGALRFRAMGRRKTGTMWNIYPDELWTLRDAKINEQAARVFGDLDFEEIVRQMNRVARKKTALLDAISDGELRDVISQRLGIYRDISRTAQTLNEDMWRWGYIDGFTRHSVGLRQAGIIDALPGRLKHEGIKIKDQNGLLWDHLRGRNSAMRDVAEYMRANGGDYEIIEYWMGRQGGSSWSGASQAVKSYISEQRGGDTSLYFWRDGVEKARGHYEGAIAKLGKQKYDDTLQMWHAFNYEFVRNVQFTRNNLRKGYLELVRTESLNIMQAYDLKPGDTGVTMQRGACESASIYQTVVVAGDQLTLQRVPHHRVFGMYFYERSPGSGISPFLGDGENEVVFIPEGMLFDYVGTTKAHKLTAQFWESYVVRSEVAAVYFVEELLVQSEQTGIVGEAV